MEPAAEPAAESLQVLPGSAEESATAGHADGGAPAAPAADRSMTEVAHDDVSEEEEALWQTLLHSPAALAACAGISAARLHELFVRASAQAAESNRSGAADAGAGYRVGALREAATTGDLTLVNSYLAAGVDPNAFTEQLAEWGPLQYAARHGHTAVVQALLDAGADPLAVDTSTGETARTQAQYWGHTDAAELLAARGGTAAGSADVVPVVLSQAQETALRKNWFSIFCIPIWRADGILPGNLTQLICSAPEFTRDPTDEHHAVMVDLFKLCDKSAKQAGKSAELKAVKFGYDWGGSATVSTAACARFPPLGCVSHRWRCVPGRARRCRPEPPRPHLLLLAGMHLRQKRALDYWPSRLEQPKERTGQHVVSQVRKLVLIF